MRNVVLSGGVGHDFPVTSGRIADLLAPVGFESVIHDDLETGLEAFASAQLVTVNMLRWRMPQPKYASERARWGLQTDSRLRAALSDFVHRGGGLLGIHTASICFDDWPEWRGLLGGRWDWGRSSHPPLGSAEVTVHDARHSVVSGIGCFVVEDEIYGSLDCEPGIIPLATSSHGGADHPIVWARQVGQGRAVYDALGHHLRSYEVPENRLIVRRAALWAVGADDATVAALIDDSPAG